MSEEGTKRCVVAYATHDHQYLWTVDLHERATIADALEVARGLAAATLTTAATRQEVQEVPWDTAPVGIFGSRENGRTCRPMATALRSTDRSEATPASAVARRCDATGEPSGGKAG